MKPIIAVERSRAGNGEFFYYNIKRFKFLWGKGNF
jgi:hypothetical protein